MARLIVEQPSGRVQALLRKRVLIGRWPGNGICLADTSVSRIHAWIDRRSDGTYRLTDAGSRTGTLLNGQPIRAPAALKPGDTFTIGLATFVFSADSAGVYGTRTLEIADDGTCPTSTEEGILFSCKCGSPVWTPFEAAGKRGTCHLCGRSLIVPSARGTNSPPPSPPVREDVAESRPQRVARPALPPPTPVDTASTSTLDPSAVNADPTVCSICQSMVEPGDHTTRCPSCGQVFHAECWQENLGCSAYGCPQVNALASKSDSPPMPSPMPVALASIATSAGTHWLSAGGPMIQGQQVPWSYLLLIASPIVSIIGLVAFGIPALLVGLVTAAYWVRARPERSQVTVLMLTVGVCLAGCLGGYFFSRYFWWPNPIAVGGVR